MASSPAEDSPDGPTQELTSGPTVAEQAEPSPCGMTLMPRWPGIRHGHPRRAASVTWAAELAEAVMLEGPADRWASADCQVITVAGGLSITF